MDNWARDAVFYHIYPLGLLGTEQKNSFQNRPVNRLRELSRWADYLENLGVTALYLGPVFESSTHGYDMKDYFTVDRRLGTNSDLKETVEVFHKKGIRIILDAVFNHTGRDFFAFQDLLQRGWESPYRTWFAGLRFDRKSPFDDPFGYEGWNGHYNLVKLDLRDPAAKAHVLEASSRWIEEFSIDGLRLDAADCLDHEFIRDLRHRCKKIKHDFWLLGEVVMGDYSKWANPDMLDSVTNYECYKGLWSSHNDGNYFEIAYSLNRQFGETGIYKGLGLYNFTDNHDVNRAASTLIDKGHLYPLYCLLFTIPGVPSLYYGSEWGIRGIKGPGTDAPLRPSLTPEALGNSTGERELYDAVRRLIAIRKKHAALRTGSYRQLFVNHEQLVFSRKTGQETLIVGVNAADSPVTVSFPFEDRTNGVLDDILNGGQVGFSRGRINLDLYPRWARVLAVYGEKP